MSHIDTINHVDCGILNLNDTKLPVYWPQENIDNEYTSEVVTNRDLAVGGGSGEHPMLHVRQAHLLPLWYLAYEDYLEDDSQKLDNLLVKKLQEEMDPADHSIVNNYPFAHEYFINFAEWPLETLAKIQEGFIKNPDRQFNNSEKEFLASLALMVSEQMPAEFFDPEVYQVMQENREILERNKGKISFKFNPATADNKMGRTIKDGKVVCGYSLEDYKQEQQNYTKSRLKM